MYTRVKNFIISEGCSPTGPIFNHLYAPLTSDPIPGKKTSIRSNIPRARKSLSEISQKVVGIQIIITAKVRPTNKWKSCLVKKFNGSPVKKSEKWIEAVAIEMSPKKHNRKKIDKNIKSSFLTSGKEK